MGLGRYRVPARRVLRNPYPESTRRDLPYSLYGGKEDHEERRRLHRARWLTITLPRVFLEMVKEVARRDGMYAGPWLVHQLERRVRELYESLPEKEGQEGA